jgi:hypothetical protein
LTVTDFFIDNKPKDLTNKKAAQEAATDRSQQLFYTNENNNKENTF